MKRGVHLAFAAACCSGVLPTAPLRSHAADPPVVPLIDSSMQERLRAVFQAGQSAGNRADVLSKIGDSNTATYSFLSAPFGCPEYDLGGHTELQPVIDRFSAYLFPPETTDVWCGVSNSFSRVSLCAESGWTAAAPLEPIPGPPAGCTGAYSTHLECELLTARPSVALIMFGTNDLVWDDPGTFRGRMEAIIDGCLAAGVIPVLSTIPPRLAPAAYGDLVPAFNAVIADVARVSQVPLWNFWLALQGTEMVNQGMGADGIHPSVYGNCDPDCIPGSFTAEGLRYGFNQRNYTALQVLDKIVRVVMDGAGPDPAPASLVDLTANKTEVSTTDSISVTADVSVLSTPCWPFVRVVTPDGSALYYESGRVFSPSPTPYLGFAAGPVTSGAPMPGYPVFSAAFSGIPAGAYVLEGGAVDAARTSSADDLVYYGTVDREILTVRRGGASIAAAYDANDVRSGAGGR